MRNTIRLALACGLTVLVSACATTFAKPEAGAQSVLIVTAAGASGCKKIGRAAVSVPYKLGFIHRSALSVADDLRTMGKNSAVDMHGDTIVATDQPHQGKQSFDVYRCRQ